MNYDELRVILDALDYYHNEFLCKNLSPSELIARCYRVWESLEKIRKGEVLK